MKESTHLARSHIFFQWLWIGIFFCYLPSYTVYAKPLISGEIAVSYGDTLPIDSSPTTAQKNGTFSSNYHPTHSSSQFTELNRNRSLKLASADLEALESDIIAETNLMRSDPSAYAEKLIALRNYYEGNLIKIPGQPVIEVVEGVAALDEAIAALQKTKPLPSLEPKDGLTQAAKDHAEDLSAHNLGGHYGTDESDPFIRISRYGSWEEQDGGDQKGKNAVAGENISFGLMQAEWHVIQLLVDDDVPDRSHRKVLFNPDYRDVGCACTPHPSFEVVCVMTYASDFQEH